jgi:dephospho-CoA kinase
MVGLTGGIGSGKSAVSARLAGHGALVIDSDRLAREVVAPGTEGLAEIVATFGEQVRGPDGSLDRPALGEIVFRDPTARGRLEAIIHPRVRARTAELAMAAAPDAVVVNDVPLLVEVGLAPTYHLVVVVRTAPQIRVGRLVEHRGMSVDEAHRRIAAQASDERREAAADVVLVNEGALAELHVAVDTLWRERLVPYEWNVRNAQPAGRQPVRLVAGDPGWPAAFDRVAARLRHAIGDRYRLDHIGSTSVPGLTAKDVIDVQLTVSSLTEADGLAGRLAAAGFPRWPGDWWDNPRYPDAEPRWEKRLHGSADPGRPVNLHLRVAGSPGWRFALLMRDHLRADAEARADYLTVKRRLAAENPDPAAYAMGKDPWFDAEHLAAEKWAAATGWRP